MLHAPVDELTAERESLPVGVEQAQAENDTLANRVRQLEDDAATCNGELGTLVRAVP